MNVVTVTDRAIVQAADLLRAGKLVAFPTETVYGLGADATNGIAAAKIFQAKGRPRFNPMIAHVADVAAAGRLVVMTELARRLAEAFWPGPLTLVLKRSETCAVADLVSAGLPTLAVRVPSHPVARDLLQAVDSPVAAPSANRSGRISPTRAEHVAEQYADADLAPAMILDAGATDVGLESTVVLVDGDELVLLRPGGVTSDEIAEVAGCSVSRASDPGNRPSAPGMLKSHYAPRAKVRLNAESASGDEAFIMFGPDEPDHDGSHVNISPAGDLREAAANLFAALHDLDAQNVSCIAVSPIPETGLGEAINDRLRRAAAPRVTPRQD